MQFGLSETQQTLKTTTRQFLSAECPSAEVRRLMETETAFDPKLWSKLADQGWTGIIFPEESGGFGMGLVEMAAILEEMGRALLPGPFLATLLAGAVLERLPGGPASEHLASISRGETKATLAFLEESASWDPERVRLPAQAAAEGYVLNGRKAFVPDAAVADLLICAACLDGELALFAIPASSPGLQIRATPAIDGTRKLCEALFDEVQVPQSALLARGAGALAALERGLAVATVALTAEMLGGMQRLLEVTVEYAKTRKQFGRPIGQFQAVQHLCADMLLLTESTRSAVYYAAWAMSQGAPDAAAAVSVAKAYASDAYREVGNRAIQVHGGMGFTWENDVHLYYRRAKASEIAFGDAVYHRERLAKLVLDRRPASHQSDTAIT